MATVGAVLCGGASRRMGRDKALIEVDGEPMVRRVVAALREGGCASALAVGGDADALAVLGLDAVPDRWPGEGPLGGLATALGAAAAARAEVLVVAPCDWLHPAGAVVEALVAALGPQGVQAVGVDVDRGRRQWLPSAWRVTADLADRVADAVGAGARRLDAVEGVVAGLATVEVTAGAVADADTPDDLVPGDDGRREVPAADRDGRR